MERDLIREKLTECHLNGYDYGETEEMQNPFRTEVRDNFVNTCSKKPKCKYTQTQTGWQTVYTYTRAYKIILP